LKKNHEDKVHFFNDIHFIRTKTLTPSVISAGWRETGLYPMNFDLVWAKLELEKPVDMLD
jgi:hypothetical protein